MAPVVHIPTVGAGRVRFIPLTVQPYSEYDGKMRFANAPDLPNTTDLLMDARHHEPPGRRDRGVVVTIDASSVVDRSYGLGLAIADKLAAFGGGDGHIIATGVIVDRGLGAIGPVGDFDTKVAAILSAAAELPRPLIFAFPAPQLNQLRQDLRTQLEAMATAGDVRLFPCNTVSDAAPIWTALDAAPAHRSVLRRWRPALLAAAGVAVGLAAHAWYQAPIRQCEADASRLADNPTRQEMAAAVAACRAAISRFPTDGRMLFLAAQALIANAGGAVDPDAMDLLAQSATNGDPDGRIAHAHAIWLNPFATAGARGLAAAQLATEAQAGHAGAAELLGLIRLIGDNDNPGDPSAAAPWLAKAVRLRQAAATATDDGAKILASPWEQLGSIGLTATLDRPMAVYPPGSPLGVSIASRRPVAISVWRVDASGMAMKLVDQTMEAGQVAQVMPVGTPGRHQLLVVARATDQLPPDPGLGRALTADAGLVGSNTLMVKWLPYDVAGKSGQGA